MGMTREDAIQILSTRDAHGVLCGYTSGVTEALDMAIEALKDRPHGEWKHTITWQPYCSNCEYVFDEDEEYSPFWKFCPMCGAEMADNSLFNDITESPNDVVESKDDVIEVVRCKDCKHYIVEGITTQYGWCHEYKHSVNEDDYCSYGERRKP